MEMAMRTKLLPVNFFMYFKFQLRSLSLKMTNNKFHKSYLYENLNRKITKIVGSGRYVGSGNFLSLVVT